MCVMVGGLESRNDSPQVSELRREHVKLQRDASDFEVVAG